MQAKEEACNVDPWIGHQLRSLQILPVPSVANCFLQEIVKQQQKCLKVK